MRGFENRIKLPEVLDEVHRQVAISTLARCGIELTYGSWDEIDERSASEALDNYDLTEVIYEGTRIARPFFNSGFVLHESSTTQHAIGADSKDWHLGAQRWEREIYMKPPGARSVSNPLRIMFSPDSPPLALHGDDYAFITKGFSRGEIISTPPMTWANRVRAAFGDGAAEYISEEAAGSIINALMSEEKRSSRLDEV